MTPNETKIVFQGDQANKSKFTIYRTSKDPNNSQMTGRIPTDPSNHDVNESVNSELQVPVQNKGFKGINVAAAKNRRNL